MLQLLAIAGGFSAGGEDFFIFCGCFPIVPLVAFLSVWVVYRNATWSPRAAIGAVLVAGLPYLLARLMVAGYQPSDDGDVVADQGAGRRAVVFYGWLTVFACLSVLAVIGRRLVTSRRKKAEPVTAPDGDERS